MSTLQRIEKKIENLQRQQKTLEAEIAKLESAAEVCREVDNDDEEDFELPVQEVTPKLPGANGDFPDATASDAASYVLKAMGNPPDGIQYRTIFEHAAQLGWKGRRDTLRRTMNERKSVFQGLGDGLFRLIESND